MSRNVKIVLGAALLFLSGLVVGGVVTSFYMKRGIRQYFEGGPPQREIVVKRLTKALGLDPRQREKLAEVVEETQNELLELRRKWVPETKEIFDRAIERMRPILDERQNARLDELYAKFRRRFEERGKGEDGPGRRHWQKDL